MTLEEIVAGLRSSNDAAVELVSRLDEDQWRLLTPSEAWPVGVTTRHIALGHRRFVGWVEGMVAGDDEFGGRQMPRMALLGASLRHVDSHLASIRAAVGAEGPA